MGLTHFIESSFIESGPEHLLTRKDLLLSKLEQPMDFRKSNAIFFFLWPGSTVVFIKCYYSPPTKYFGSIIFHSNKWEI